MPEYRFYQLDVFTDRAFGGNPLAVFPDATGLDTPTMQRLAVEMNLSETTFVFPPEDSGADYRVRIFTPAYELPFAGHPVVGTHWLLAHIGRYKLQEPITRASFALNVGVRAAALHVKNGVVTQVTMDHARPEFGAKATPQQVAEMARGLGLAPEAVTETGFPVQVVSTGVKQFFVPVRSLKEIQALNAYKQDPGRVMQVCQEIDPSAHIGVMVFCTETTDSQANVHSRFFVPGAIPEDPATGSASGGLGAYLIENGVLKPTPPTTSIFSEQGIEMGRPSRIGIEIDGQPGSISMIRVSGQAVPMIEGVVRW